MPAMRVVIVTPVYEDWESFGQLVRELDAALAAAPALDPVDVAILAVDDGSTDRGPGAGAAWAGLVRIARIEVLRLAVNMGHQRAIALGAVHVANNDLAEAAVFMDADGEDRPADVVRLIETHLAEPGKIVLAGRARRSEPMGFRFGYRLYRLAFRLLTGHDLPFGNFSLVPRAALARLVCNGDLWNHFAATISRSRLPVVVIPTSRGTRYAGQSHMNWVTLAIHGLSAMSVHSDRVATRLIFASVCVTAVAVLAIAGVVAIRFLTDLAIPGWASQVVGTLALASLISVGFAALLAFVTLQSRQQLTFFPRTDGLKYIHRVETWWPATAANTSAKN
jgi:hypothetical protein